jgi:hypothetical protein
VKASNRLQILYQENLEVNLSELPSLEKEKLQEQAASLQQNIWLASTRDSKFSQNFKFPLNFAKLFASNFPKSHLNTVILPYCYLAP